MKAVAVHSFGGPEGMALVDLPVPVPRPDQVLIAVEAAGVGGVDVMIRRGDLASYGFREGHVLGGEVAGVVTSVGEDVDPSWKGRRVWASTGSGGYAELAVAPAEEVVALPADLPVADAVALGSAGVVAHFGLAHARFTPGESVLVRGASGSLGIMTVQLAAREGTVSVTTSSAERGERLRALGATHVLDRSGSSGSYDVIIDVVAGRDLPSLFDRLNPNGRLVVVGAVAGQPPADFGARMMAAFQKSLSFATFSAATVPEPAKREVRADQFAAAVRGELRAVVHERLPLEQAALAHRRMDAGEVFGRIVLTV
ncbi:zinc-dependent alcohol dehydrogenase family protein [Lentzea sp. NPDC059081]|uniref:zinc-dependent alcohol dehydrogenase family protein n=1 Tax=Lentzea sp. NPDC059081 TaxID=3346719 RepID=UPI003697820E